MFSPKQRFLDFLFRRHGKELVAFAGQRSCHEAAEDIVQDAYLRMLRHPDPQSIENPRAFLYRITANLTINRFRHEKIRSGNATIDPIDWDNVSSPSPGPETITDDTRQFERFLSALDELPESCRDAFILHKVDGMTYAQIAKSLGVSPKTAQRYIDKAWQHCLLRLAAD